MTPLRILAAFGQDKAATGGTGPHERGAGPGVDFISFKVSAMVRALAVVLLSLSLALGLAAPSSAATIEITVNGEGITDYQIQQRLNLFRLEGRSGRNTAVDELINEAIMRQEAERIGVTATRAEVDNAILNVARNINMSPQRLREVLSQGGVGIETLEARMRAAIGWQRVVERTVAPRVQISELELDQRATAGLTNANSYDYILKEVLFLTGSRGSASQRTGQANQYRQSFSGCDNAVQLSLSYTDAAVINVGRRHATQLPEAIASELAGLNVGGITKPRVVENGVSMLAVCEKAVAQDTTFLKGQLRQQQGNEALTAQAKEHLDGLRAKAAIVRR